MEGSKPFGVLAERKGMLLSPTKPRAVRRLFGPSDHEEIKRSLDEQMQLINKRNAERWNFDFEHERPMEGPYHWERVEDGDECVPEAYKLPRVTISISCKQVPFRRVHTLSLQDNDTVPSSSDVVVPSSVSCTQPDSESASDPLEDSIVICESTPDVDPEKSTSTPNKLKRKRIQTQITGE